ncbi:nucleotidyltransferase [candidate division WOR-1 bacterium RIFCSPHIGHO2_01_FULL_53_15]|uniref:Nucleotidyltransferase n=1 Tax=candidate division WOR-1 bacterium RIFCSPHIGHO2_01_FULL_53_15 TaxID=1802564 RepID=A0A1F4Q6A6_UNCSA|nr:MAG: nucleotidyltransferase [candidate division WOR-1 bacterium RIFCSPHIGHO2_01_FULL_53_15]OGC13233.1 MAG: nucleotidyltransferase [candidate division WOR-1 bacterium RIFCSPHIGHO2_02_FULL_53_26]
MRKIEEIKKKLSQHKDEVERKFNVSELGVFGSYVRDEQNKKSDVDILVDFKEPIGLFKFMDLEEFLHKILGIKIDLVSKKALKPRIGAHVLKEVVFI